MPSLKDVKTKIFGVKKTQQITKAMNMVAAAKLRGAQKRMEDFRPYAEKFGTVMAELSGTANPNAFPLMATRPVKTILLLMISSDRGLCGPFNSNLINAAEKFARNHKNEGRNVVMACIGRKGASYFSRGQYELLYRSVDVMGNIQMFNARQAGLEIMKLFLEEKVDEVQLLYGRFVNVVVQKPNFKRLLPISQKGLGNSESEGSKIATATYTYEPEPEQILNQLLPMYVNVQIMHAMLETAASEQAARMTSMDNATRACKDIISSLTLIYNKVRQSSITKELMDIVGGAEALKG